MRKGERAYSRSRALARVALRVVEPGGEERARRRVRGRHVPPTLPPGSLEEARLAAEQRALLLALERISVTLARLDRRVEDLVRAQVAGEAPLLLPEERVEISLSPSGFAGPFDLDVEPGALVEVDLDLAGLPVIPALARVVRALEGDADAVLAFSFEECAAEDRERIVELTLRSAGEPPARGVGRGE